MIWLSIGGAGPEFPEHSLVLPSCDPARVDQFALDCLCFNAGTLVGRLISQNLDFVTSQDPYRGGSTTLSSAIDVYRGDVPALGPSIFLRVASPLPAAKRLLFDYAREVVDFAKAAGVRQILLVRSVASLFCIDAQIADWPLPIRGFGPAVNLLRIKPLEDYAGTSDTLKAAVVGEFFECLRRLSALPFGAVFMFVEEPVTKTEAAVLARTVSGLEKMNEPPGWIEE
jgi:hypothetical protein